MPWLRGVSKMTAGLRDRESADALRLPLLGTHESGRCLVTTCELVRLVRPMAVAASPDAERPNGEFGLVGGLAPELTLLREGGMCRGSGWAQADRGGQNGLDGLGGRGVAARPSAASTAMRLSLLCGKLKGPGTRGSRGLTGCRPAVDIRGLARRERLGPLAECWIVEEAAATAYALPASGAMHDVVRTIRVTCSRSSSLAQPSESCESEASDVTSADKSHEDPL